ncbi:MAG: hypothetical protein EBU54_17295, partial [Mycobacteriaceae bacterium]|nr:hypothetical protein [Mycobacteriaceae bacterium]
MQRRPFLISSAAALVHGFAVAQTPAWPARPVRIVIAYPPGGSTDVAGRLLAQQLGARLGQQVVVENRAGAGGTLGANSVVRSDPDGYTLLLAASPEVSIAPITMKAMPYDPVRDLLPITGVGQVPFFLVVNPAVPANTLEEFIAYARANGEKLNYSSFGNNTSNHLAGELFKSLTGTRGVHVPYWPCSRAPTWPRPSATAASCRSRNRPRSSVDSCRPRGPSGRIWRPKWASWPNDAYRPSLDANPPDPRHADRLRRSAAPSRLRRPAAGRQDPRYLPGRQARCRP